MKSFTTKNIRTGAAFIGLCTLGSGSIILTNTASGAPKAEEPKAAARENSASSSSLQSQDSEFINNAVRANAEEIALGLLAIQKSTSKEVKDFGRDLVDTHVQAFRNLIELAVRKSQFIPMAQIQISPIEMEQLNSRSGADFDKAFITAVIGKQTRNQANLQRYEEMGGDNEIRDYAKDLLSSIKDRISDAQQLGTSMGIAGDLLNPPPVAESPDNAPSSQKKP